MQDHKCHRCFFLRRAPVTMAVHCPSRRSPSQPRWECLPHPWRERESPTRMHRTPRLKKKIVMRTLRLPRDLAFWRSLPAWWGWAPKNSEEPAQNTVQGPAEKAGAKEKRRNSQENLQRLAYCWTAIAPVFVSAPAHSVSETKSGPSNPASGDSRKQSPSTTTPTSTIQWRVSTCCLLTSATHQLRNCQLG